LLVARGTGFVTSGTVARIGVPAGPQRFEVAATRAADVLGAIAVEDPDGVGPAARPRAVGALPYAAASDGRLVVPAVLVGVEADGTAWRTELALAGAGGRPAAGNGGPGPDLVRAVERASSDGLRTGRPPRRFTVRPDRPPHQWMAAVERAVAAIKDGRIDKVVLAREVLVDADVPFDRTAVLARLRDANPLAFVYADGPFVGATPELLVRRTGRLVASNPMAGTVRQGAPDDDRRVAALAASGKDLAEHRLTVDAVREALAPVTEVLKVPDRPAVVRLPTVAHLATSLSGRLRDPAPSVLALVQRLHPTPAVGGVPRLEALALQAELEGFDRGRYAGPVGWVDADGDGEFAVALRGADLSGLDGRRARLVAGNGIVEGSQPEEELAETRAKLEPMLRALVQV
jgi:menaquinone-specific isochorismate synthase